MGPHVKSLERGGAQESVCPRGSDPEGYQASFDWRARAVPDPLNMGAVLTGATCPQHPTIAFMAMGGCLSHPEFRPKPKL
uniref:Uncharacterized protein n=1 Tax=Oryza brachyantha TaxID=4533 RepID=J3L4P3_ORYBR